MAGWAGFSEDELRRLRLQPGSSPNQRQAACPPEAFFSPPKPPSKKSVRDPTPGKRVPPAHTPRGAAKDHSQSQTSDHSETRAKMVQSAAPVPSTPKSPTLPDPSHGARPRPQEEEAELTVEMEVKEKPRLDQLQLEQRVMEEKNKRKKALLTKAISEKSRKTQAEAMKLKRIQAQLQALDDLVSTDIGILRSRIEHACKEFSQARRRYDRAEREFVEAKLELQKKTQLKEQLTEHLCTIIQQNELRKANRLEELMKQLELEADEEALELEIEVEHMLQRQEAEAAKGAAGAVCERAEESSNIPETCSAEVQASSPETSTEKVTPDPNPSSAGEEAAAVTGDGTHPSPDPKS